MYSSDSLPVLLDSLTIPKNSLPNKRFEIDHDLEAFASTM